MGKFITTCVIEEAFSLENIEMMNLLPSMLKTYSAENTASTNKNKDKLMQNIISDLEISISYIVIYLLIGELLVVEI